MSYEPTEWKSGDVISSVKLNKIENGIVNSDRVKIVDMILINDGAGGTEIDCTWQQLCDWMNAGYLVFAKIANTSPDGISGGGSYFACPILAVMHVPAIEEELYGVSVLMVKGPTTAELVLFEAPASDEHPIYSPSEQIVPFDPDEPGGTSMN